MICHYATLVSHRLANSNGKVEYKVTHGKRTDLVCRLCAGRMVHGLAPAEAATFQRLTPAQQKEYETW